MKNKFALDGSSAAEEVHDDGDHGQDQQEVDQPAGDVKCGPSQRPYDEQYKKQREEHTIKPPMSYEHPKGQASSASACAVFFDRDGTLMEDVHYCADPSLVKIYPGVPDALRQLRTAGFRTFVITNQSGIGRGLITEAQYRAVAAEFLRQIGEGLIDATYFCPDAPDVPSTRRKPEPGMVLEAAADFGIRLAASYFVGDKCADIGCGRRAGTRTIQVRTGYGSQAEQECRPDLIADDVVDAVRWILRQ